MLRYYNLCRVGNGMDLALYNKGGNVQNNETTCTLLRVFLDCFASNILMLSKSFVLLTVIFTLLTITQLLMAAHF
jgi:hypothetical protein